MRIVFTVSALVLLALGAGCGGSDRVVDSDYPPRITHVVLARLNDPGDAPALLKESRKQLSTIPGVRFYADGPPFESGRPTVDKDYDAAVLMGFDTPEDYQRYVDHPRHVEFVASWRPRFKWLRVHDVDTRNVRR